MTDTFATVNGIKALDVRLTVANVGPWFIDCDLIDDTEVSGSVTVAIDTLMLTGTIDPTHSGVFGLKRKLRIVAGAGGWSSLVPVKAYHNDANIKALTIAQDAARAVGETIGAFVPRVERVGIDYVRGVTTAASVLEDVVGGVPWWVGFNGLTNVGERPAVAVSSDDYQVLAYDARDRVITLTAEDLTKINIGSIITNGLDSPQTIRSFELSVTTEGVRIVAWCAGSANGLGNLPELLRSIARRSLDDHLFGMYRYRVVLMSSDRVELQAVRKNAGLPDILPVSMWPGVAGVHAELAPGAEVLVEFIEGNRTMPIITQFAGKDGVGFVPVSLAIGGGTGPQAARQGDAVEVLLPPAMFTGTIGGSPSSGIVQFITPKALGVITAGSGIVKIA